MNLKNGEREPSDEEDGIPERQFDFNLVVMDVDESDGSPHANDENMVLESSTSDSETVYTQSLSGVPPPSPIFMRHSSSNQTVEDEAEPDTAGESSSTSESQVSSESSSRTQPFYENTTATAGDLVESPSSNSISASGVEIVRDLLDDVLMSFIQNSDFDCGRTIENQDAVADDVGSFSVLASNIQMHLEDLVPLESYPSSQSTEADIAGTGQGQSQDSGLHSTQHPSLDPFPSSASTLLLSQSPIPAGSGLSTGLVHSPDREPPIPIARSSPVIHNLKARGNQSKLVDQEAEDNLSSSQDGLDLDEVEDEFESESDSGDNADCFMGVMKGIEQLQPKANEKEDTDVSQDMFASQSQEIPRTQESHSIEKKRVEVEFSTAALSNFVEASRKYNVVNQTDQPHLTQELPSTSNVNIARQVAVIVPNDTQATPLVVIPNQSEATDSPPSVGAKRPLQDVDELGGNPQAQEPNKAKRKLDFRAKKKRISKSKRAGLVFPVSRINNRIKDGKYAKRSGVTAGVYMAGVLEYLVAELAELAGRIAV